MKKEITFTTGSIAVGKPGRLTSSRLSTIDPVPAIIEAWNQFQANNPVKRKISIELEKEQDSNENENGLGELIIDIVDNKEAKVINLPVETMA